jgi:hypothetical protein
MMECKPYGMAYASADINRAVSSSVNRTQTASTAHKIVSSSKVIPYFCSHTHENKNEHNQKGKIEINCSDYLCA